MSDVTETLKAVEQSDRQAANDLLPLVYDELRRLAAQKLAQERPGQTLQPTALVHEAYLRLIGPANVQGFANRRHFFGAAAEAMRRILVDQARRKQLMPRIELADCDLAVFTDERLVELNDAVDQLAKEEPVAAELVKLRVFAGVSLEDAADILAISRATAFRDWAYARAWLSTALH